MKHFHATGRAMPKANENPNNGNTRTLAKIYTLLFCFMLFCLPDARPQSVEIRTAGAGRSKLYTITGKIKTKYANNILEGARIGIVGSNDHCFSDREGAFSLSTDVKDGALEISCRGFGDTLVSYIDASLPRGAQVVRLVRDLPEVQLLALGDTIPQDLWQQRFSVLNHGQGRTKVSLQEYRHAKVLVLDFWATWCKPCILSMDKWNGILKASPDRDVAVVGVNVGFYDRTAQFMKDHGWIMPCFYDESTRYLSRYFFAEDQVGGQVWIVDGKVSFIGFAKEAMRRLQELGLPIPGNMYGQSNDMTKTK